MTTESRELVLYAENNGDLYRQRIQPVLVNLRKKLSKKTYDANKALVLWKYVADDAAQRYTKEFGSGGTNGSYGIFSPEDRRIAAKELAENYDEELRYDSAARKNPGRRPVTRSGKHCLILGYDMDRREIGYFDGQRLQADKSKALLYGSSLAAKSAAKRLKRRKGLTYIIAPSHWTAQQIRVELGDTRSNPAPRAEISRAANRLARFSGHRAKTATTYKRPSTKVGFELGPIRDITYIAKRDGEVAAYRHAFKMKSRPSLVASSDGTHLEIVGGRFRVTEKGITDH